MKLKSILANTSNNVLTINELRMVVGGKKQICKCALFHQNSVNIPFKEFSWENVGDEYQCKLKCDEECEKELLCSRSEIIHANILDPIGGGDDGSGSGS